MQNDYLSHHGIKGQKWGVRRFQNPDGTRTALGKKREREIDHETLIKSRDAKELYKHRDQLSDKELQDRLNRLRNEEALRQFADSKKKKDKGQSVARKVLQKVGEQSAGIIATAIVGATVAKAAKSIKANGVIGTIQRGYNAYNTMKEYAPDFYSMVMGNWELWPD